MSTMILSCLVTVKLLYIIKNFFHPFQAPCKRYILSGNPKITDQSFEASSIYNTAYLIAGAQRVRLDAKTETVKGGNLKLSGGWRPATDNLNQFLQVQAILLNCV